MAAYFLIAAIFLSLSAALFLYFGADLRTGIEVLLLAAGLLPVVIQRTPRLYMAIRKLRFFLANTPATWDLAVHFREVRSAGSPAQVAESLVRWGGDGSALITSSSSKAVIRLLRRFVVEIYEPPMDSPPEADNEPLQLQISISPVTVGYRDSRRFIDKELLPLLEKLKDETGASWVSYALRIDLPEHNPFYGLYLQRLNLDSVKDFRIEFHIPTRNRESRVTVAKRRLTVAADSLEAFRAAVGAALAFRVPEGR